MRMLSTILAVHDGLVIHAKEGRMAFIGLAKKADSKTRLHRKNPKWPLEGSGAPR
jgi:hypothetical protein